MTYDPILRDGHDRPGRWRITCDHATNTVPPEIAPLGLPAGDMARHIAFDPGAWGVSLALGQLLDSPVIGADFSRLVIDPNRGEDDPTLVMKLYDGSIVPGNRHVGPAELERRKALCYRPYHAALGAMMAPDESVLLAIHSYTRQLDGRPPRPWHVGVLHAADDRLARPLLRRLRAEPDFCVGENEPYGGHLPGDSVDRHAIALGRLNVLIELRNDLIATTDQQTTWATRLAPILQAALAEVCTD